MDMNFYRKIYKMIITLESPLAIGSGTNENTDKDIIVDSVGNPFIPASALAGTIKSYVKSVNGKAVADSLFGYIQTKKDNKKCSSKIMVYDGVNSSKESLVFITNRDMVALENKIVKNSAKFDMQAVETGSEFTAYIELLDKDYQEVLESALAAMNAGVVRLGSKSTRGYGQVSLKVYSKEIDNAEKWLNFDMMDENSWGEENSLKLGDVDNLKITIGLKLIGGISIREYTTEPSTNKETAPDYKQLSLHNNERTPVIPGTSWAGAFRTRFAEFSNNYEVNALFGTVDSEKVKKSNITFSESQLTGGLWKKTTRNAIDRFTGGTKAGALYTEETYYSGNTELIISFKEKPDKLTMDKICACLADLHNGFLAIGGLTSIGRGLFNIVSINCKILTNEDIKPDKIYSAIKKEVCIDE